MCVRCNGGSEIFGFRDFLPGLAASRPRSNPVGRRPPACCSGSAPAAKRRMVNARLALGNSTRSNEARCRLIWMGRGLGGTSSSARANSPQTRAPAARGRRTSSESGNASDMKLYNTQSAALEPFQASGGSASLYVCGITPYDTTHLGHAFTYTTADVLVRYLESQGIAVRYVQNVTDIDDDILGKAREVGEDWRAVGKRWTAHFIDNMQRLNISPPHHLPCASDFVTEIVTATGALIERGLAYVSG